MVIQYENCMFAGEESMLNLSVGIHRVFQRPRKEWVQPEVRTCLLAHSALLGLLAQQAPDRGLQRPRHGEARLPKNVLQFCRNSATLWQILPCQSLLHFEGAILGCIEPDLCK